MAKFGYFLTESALAIRGRRVVVDDPYDDDNARRISLEGLEVELAHQAQSEGRIEVSVERGTRDFDAEFTADGRLRSLSYNSTGAGAAVVGGLGKIIAFAGSVLLGVRRGGALADEDGKPIDPRAKWEAANPDLIRRREEYVATANMAADALSTLRSSMVNSEPHDLRGAELRERALTKLHATATDQVIRIEKSYAEWRAAQRVITTTDVGAHVRISELPRRAAGSGYDAPAPPTAGQAGFELWQDLGLYFERVDARLKEPEVGPHNDRRSNVVWWREPRDVELWVWKRGEGEELIPVSTQIIRVTDRTSTYRSMELTSRVFGEHGGTLAFNDDGSPSSIAHNQESAWASFANALGDLPEATSTAVTQAKDALASIASIRDAQAEREKVRVQRELDVAKNQLELAGVLATQEQHAALQRAEQAVALQTAQRSLSPEANPVEDLKRELELISTQNKIDAERRTAGVETSVADLRAEVARLQLEVSKLEAVAKLAQGDGA